MTKKPINPNKIKKKAGSLGINDDALWQHIAAGVEPLEQRHKNRTLDVEPIDFPSDTSFKKEPARRSLAPGGMDDTKLPSRQVSLPELSHGRQPGLDKNNAKRLKKGQHAIEGRMDLHGMTQEQAHRALNAFIDGAFGAGKRCVLVITGKGLKQDGSVGVLRAAVPNWLNQSPNREKVLAFSYATPKDGGEGALYVLLKRKR